MILAVSLALMALASAAYDDTLARTKLMPMSAASYSKTPSSCINSVFTNGTLKRQIEVFCDKTMIDKCSGFTAVSYTDQAIILAYRGTDRNIQLFAEADETMLKNHTPWAAGGKVSEYFDNGFTRLWNQGMKNDFTTLLNKNPTFKVWITGHSLGGAMAVLSASYIAHNKLVDGSNIFLYTFGEPRVGDTDFATAVDNEVKNAYRVVHNHDMVAHLPLKNEEGYHHHKTEIYYKEDMGVGAEYKVCNTGDESLLCSDAHADISIKDHLVYFNQDVSDYGAKGCK